MSNTDTKKYRLLKDYSDPNGNVSAGVVKDEHQWMARFALLNPGDCEIKKDWFEEEVLPEASKQPTQEKATVVIDYNFREYQIIVTSTKEILKDKFPAIKQAIESALNDTVVERKVKLEDCRIISDHIRSYHTTGDGAVFLRDWFNGLENFPIPFSSITQLPKSDTLVEDDVDDIVTLKSYIKYLEQTLEANQSQIRQADLISHSQPLYSKQGIKPPLGLLDKRIWEYNRLNDVTAAIERYKEAGKEIPQAWIDEQFDLKKQSSETQSENLKIDFEQLKNGLNTIANWDLPKHYEADYGTSGVRDYMKSIAKKMLELIPQNQPFPGKKGTKILSFLKDGKPLVLDEKGWKYRNDTNSISDLLFLLQNYPVNSIEREDGQIFTIGDIDAKYGKILRFEIPNNMLENAPAASLLYVIQNESLVTAICYDNKSPAKSVLLKDLRKANQSAAPAEKPLLIITTDGVPVYDENLVIYSVCPKGSWETRELTYKKMNWFGHAPGQMKSHKSWLHFSTKWARENYILRNRHLFSIEDLVKDGFIYPYLTKVIENLEEKGKEKLGKSGIE